jgi:hypothetical protein
MEGVLVLNGIVPSFSEFREQAYEYATGLSGALVLRLNISPCEMGIKGE